MKIICPRCREEGSLNWSSRKHRRIVIVHKNGYGYRKCHFGYTNLEWSELYRMLREEEERRKGEQSKLFELLEVIEKC
jgi:hypothetical protein